MAIFDIVARIPAERVRSLIWESGTLVDWVSGGNRFELDGTVISGTVSYPYRFDAACGSPSGEYAVIYERLGTKGLVLKRGDIIREINRSYYWATAYEFPVCFGQLESGEEVLVYCPLEYNCLEIERIETGDRLTHCDGREPGDYFHSRLAVDPSSSLLLSAGWVWHPFGSLAVYRLNAAVLDPVSLDVCGVFPKQMTEISSAAFIDNQYIAFSTSRESFADEEDFLEGEVRPSSLAIWDTSTSRVISQVQVAEPLGTLFPIDSRIIVGFYEHPKAVDTQTGTVVARMDDVNSGKQTSSIIHHIESPPPLALDPRHHRFAVVCDSEIVVVHVRLDE